MLFRANLEGNLAAALAAARAGMNQARADSEGLGEALKRLNATWETSGDTYDETAQKFQDLRNRADEFGASIEVQRAAVWAATDAAERFGRPVAITARFMEELIIETQDAARAIELMDGAMAFAARTGLRVEDAVMQFVEATRGGTIALREFGDEGARLADAIDQISDPAQRAAAAQAALQQLTSRQPDLLDRANAAWTRAAGQLDAFQARLGPVGMALGVVSGAALGAAAVVGGVLVGAIGASIKAFLEQDKAASSSAKRVAQEWDRLKAALGGALLGGGRDAGRDAARQLSAISQALIDVRKWVDANAETIRTVWNGAVYQAAGFLKTWTLVLMSAALPLTTLIDSLVIPPRLLALWVERGLQSARVVRDLAREILGWTGGLLGVPQALEAVRAKVASAFADARDQTASATGEMRARVEGLITFVRSSFEGLVASVSSAMARVLGPSIDAVTGAVASLGSTVIAVLSAVSTAVGLDEAVAKVKKAGDELSRIRDSGRAETRALAQDSYTMGLLGAQRDVAGGFDAVRDTLQGKRGGKVLKADPEGVGGGGDDPLAQIKERIEALDEARARSAERALLLARGASGELRSALEAEEAATEGARFELAQYQAELALATHPRVQAALRERIASLGEEAQGFAAGADRLRERLSAVEALEAAERRLLAAQQEGRTVQRASVAELEGQIEATGDKLADVRAQLGLYLLAWREASDEGVRREIQARYAALDSERASLEATTEALRTRLPVQRQMEAAEKQAEDAQKVAAERHKKRLEETRAAYDSAKGAAYGFAGGVMSGVAALIAGGAKLKDFQGTLAQSLGGFAGALGASFGPAGGLLGGFVGDLLTGALSPREKDRDAADKLSRSADALERAANIFAAEQDREERNLIAYLQIPGTTFDTAVRASMTRLAREGAIPR